MASRSTSASQDAAKELFEQAKTFADMARRSGVNLTERENEPIPQACASIAGMVKLQSNRTRGNKVWQPVRASNSGEPCGTRVHSRTTIDSDDVFPAASFREPARHCTVYGDFSVGSAALPTSGREASPTNCKESVEPPVDDHAAGPSCEIVAAAVQSADKGRYTELFGKLPDPIHLHEQLGEYDGQVLFIGHPNRDVSRTQSANCTRQMLTL